MTYGEFTCEACGEIFERKRPIEDALAEANHLWTPEEMAKEGCVEVCDSCFHKLMEHLYKHPEIWRGE